MNIGIDIRPLMSPVRTGVGEYTFELLNAIFKEDTEHQYFLFCNAHGEVAHYIPKWEGNNIHYLQLSYPNKIFNLSQIIFHRPRIDLLINTKMNSKKRGPQLDVFFSPNPSFTTLTSPTKHILTIHDLSFEFFPEFYSHKQRLWHQAINPRKQCQRASLILTPSEHTRDDLLRNYHIPKEKIKVIYPGLSEYFKEKINDRDGLTATASMLKTKYSLPEHFILFFGSLEPRKNTVGLVEAFEIFKKSNSNIPSHHLVIAGSIGWKNQSILKRIRQSPYQNQIHIIPSIPAEEKAALYSLADLFIYPSFYEGFGFPILEAFAADLPVITSHLSSLPEVAENHAYLINPHKPIEIAQAIQIILMQPETKLRLIQGGREQMKKFTWQAAATQWLQTIKNIL